MATKRQKAHALITYYLKAYKSKYGRQPPGLNRNTLTYGFESLLEDYPGQEHTIIDYWFENYKSHEPQRFIYEYGKVVESLLDAEADEIERREIRKRTIERMKNVASSSQGDQGGST